MIKAKKHQHIIFFGLVFFCLIGIVTYIKFGPLNSGVLKGGEVLNSDDLLSRVGALVILPVGEEPTIATVTDLTELKQQEFFSRASIGDKVIIYAEAGKAILYSPTEDKIIEMAPINKNIVQ